MSSIITHHNQRQMFNIIIVRITCEQVSSNNKFSKCARAGCYTNIVRVGLLFTIPREQRRILIYYTQNTMQDSYFHFLQHSNNQAYNMTPLAPLHMKFSPSLLPYNMKRYGIIQQAISYFDGTICQEKDHGAIQISCFTWTFLGLPTLH